MKLKENLSKSITALKKILRKTLNTMFIKLFFLYKNFMIVVKKMVNRYITKILKEINKVKIGLAQ